MSAFPSSGRAAEATCHVIDLRYERRAWTLIYLCLGLVEGGTAAMCGMVGLVTPLRAIEIEAQSGRWSRVQLLMIEARRQQGRVVDCLERNGLKRREPAAGMMEEGR